MTGLTGTLAIGFTANTSQNIARSIFLRGFEQVSGPTGVAVSYLYFSQGGTAWQANIGAVGITTTRVQYKVYYYTT
jgi:hypothetical protein